MSKAFAIKDDMTPIELALGKRAGSSGYAVDSSLFISVICLLLYVIVKAYRYSSLYVPSPRDAYPKSERAAALKALSLALLEARDQILSVTESVMEAEGKESLDITIGTNALEIRRTRKIRILSSYLLPYSRWKI